jgi:hypothetical protein
MAGLPEFARFVRSVRGKAVARYVQCKAVGLVGAERIALTEEQRLAHVCPIVWDTERVVALTEEYCRLHRRELDAAIRRGELIECKRADWEAQQAKTEDTAAEGPQAKRAKRPTKEDDQ